MQNWHFFRSKNSFQTSIIPGDIDVMACATGNPDQVVTVKQDIRLLKSNIIRNWVDHIEQCLEKHSVDPAEINYFIPHVSSRSKEYC